MKVHLAGLFLLATTGQGATAQSLRGGDERGIMFYNPTMRGLPVDYCAGTGTLVDVGDHRVCTGGFDNCGGGSALAFCDSQGFRSYLSFGPVQNTKVVNRRTWVPNSECVNDQGHQTTFDYIQCFNP